jgi:hypothetical protein
MCTKSCRNFLGGPPGPRQLQTLFSTDREAPAKQINRSLPNRMLQVGSKPSPTDLIKVDQVINNLIISDQVINNLTNFDQVIADFTISDEVEDLVRPHLPTLT